MNRDLIGVIIGAVVVFLSQIVLAPNIALFSVVPNFLLAYALVLAVVRPMNNSTLVIAFVFGLTYDLISHSPVGAMTFLMVLATFATSRLFMVLNNNSFSMAAITLVISVLLVESFYALFLLMFGFAAGPLEAFVYRALPGALYDSIFSLIFYPIALKFFIEVPRASGTDAPHASLGPVGSVPKRIKRPRKKKTGF